MSAEAGPPQPKQLWMIIESYLEAAKGTRHGFADVTEAELLEMLKIQLLSHDSHYALVSELQKDSFNKERVNNLLHDAGRAESELHNFINCALCGDPLLTAPTKHSDQKVHEVFSIPELAEMILSMLHPEDLMSAAQVNKAFVSSIYSSSKIQTILHLRPNVDSFWNSLFDQEDNRFDITCRGAHCGVTTSHLSPPREQAMVDFHLPGLRNLWKVKARCHPVNPASDEC